MEIWDIFIDKDFKDIYEIYSITNDWSYKDVIVKHANFYSKADYRLEKKRLNTLYKQINKWNFEKSTKKDLDLFLKNLENYDWKYYSYEEYLLVSSWQFINNYSEEMFWDEMISKNIIFFMEKKNINIDDLTKLSWVPKKIILDIVDWKIRNPGIFTCKKISNVLWVEIKNLIS